MKEAVAFLKVKFPEILCALLILTFFTIPPITIGSLPAKAHITDFLLPFVALCLLKKEVFSGFSKKVIIIASVVAFYILFTIIINKTGRYYNNYFEILQVIKLTALFLFFRHYYSHEKHAVYIDVLFGILVILNLFHYFNIFNFNETVMPLFSNEGNRNLTFFGYYKNWNPGPKRMIGTLGNPNYNALLFIFFLIWYAPKKSQSTIHQIFYFIAFCLLIFCQSRTSLVAFSLIYLVNIFLSQIGYKKALLLTGLVIALFFTISKSGILMGSDTKEFKVKDRTRNYLNADMNNISKATSYTARLKIWEKTLTHVKEKPVFGHSPDKQFFYETGNVKHADSEYMLMLFRYGIIGLLGYLALYIYPSIRTLKKMRQYVQAKNMLLLSIAFMTAALMTEPLTNNSICYIYIFTVALFFQRIDPPPNTKIICTPMIKMHK